MRRCKIATRGRAAILKRCETHRNPKYSKAAQGRAAILKRREARRNPKYIKAARGRAALRNILKRQ